MARTATRTANGASEKIREDLEEHVGRIRKDIAALAGSITDAGSTLAGDARTGANAKATELRQVSEETIRDLRNQLETLEKQIGGKVRERPVAALAIAAGAGFLFAMLARR
ncbi:MAG: DUF883 domain-containing protein [Pseudomonadota bacterium]|nr:DUF883 domain-containing protein [Pseudomonadota bacterium]